MHMCVCVYVCVCLNQTQLSCHRNQQVYKTHDIMTCILKQATIQVKDIITFHACAHMCVLKIESVLCMPTSIRVSEHQQSLVLGRERSELFS